VMVFSGGGPPLTLPIISKESPEGTAFTVPFNHPVAIFSLLALPCLDPELLLWRSPRSPNPLDRQSVILQHFPNRKK
jgi:hypothetical protein